MLARRYATTLSQAVAFASVGVLAMSSWYIARNFFEQAFSGLAKIFE